MATPAQITASRVNGSLSHGPVTSEGKAASSRNALKLGIHSEAMILPGEDPAELDQLSTGYHQRYNPVGPVEHSLLAAAIRAEWLQRRYFRLEAQIINYRASTHPNPEYAVAAAWDEDHKHGNSLQRLFRRQQAADKDWLHALRALEAHQRMRQREAAEAEAEAEMQAEAELEFAPRPGAPYKPTPQPPVTKPFTSGTGSFRTTPRPSSEAPENLALRL